MCCQGHGDFKMGIPGFPESKVAGVWSGVFFIEQEGEYTFFSKSDDGSHVWVDGEMVVDNDGLHGTLRGSGLFRPHPLGSVRC